MFGKGSLLIVFGFILSISVYQRKMGEAVLSASDNFNSYYTSSLVHESALSGMNMGINKVWDQDITADTFNVVINSCTTNVSISEIGIDTVLLKAKGWMYSFEDEYYNEHNAPLKVQDSVLAYFSYKLEMSKYFWFTNNENGVYWIDGDTVFGKIHTNSVLNTNGAPVFFGKVSAYRGISPNPARKWGANPNRALFYGGWEIGVNQTVPTDMSHLVAAANTGNGGAATNTKCIYDKETYFEFLNNGDVIRQVGSDPPDTVAISSIAPTGVIYSSENVHVRGTFNGQATIYSNKSIWIDNDLVYADNPNTNPNSNDLLGLVAKNNVVMADNYANNHDLTLQACIMAIDGSFVAENYNGRPVSGRLDFTGSIAQNKRGAVGTFGNWGITHGYQKYYRYDKRLETMAPPHYPFIRSLHLVSWWE